MSRFIQVEDEEYVEGLHPIRSEHIANLLHQNVPRQETLLNLLPLIEADAIFDFSAYAPLLVEGKQRIILLNKLAEYISNKSYHDIVNVIDGLFSTDVLQHWRENQSVYDDIFSHQAGFSIIYAFPWSGLGDLNELGVGEAKSTIESWSEKINKIKKSIDPKKFDTFIFIEALSNSLAESEFTNDLSGLGRLAFWFKRFDVDCPVFQNINKAQLWKAFQLLELEDSGELFTACYEIRPDIYEAFFDKCRSEIVSLLKVRTDTLTISENNSDLLIEYFIDFESDSSINEQSVSRIDLIVPFLHPQYKTYSTQGLRPSVQGLDIHIDFDESKKQIDLKYLHRSFDIHVNRLWKNRIETNYESASVYGWQKQWHTIRYKSQELAIKFVDFFEAILEQDEKKFKRSKNKIIKLYSDFFSYLDSVKEFPTSVKEFNSEKFDLEFRAIRDWASSWRNFVYQLLTLGQNQNSNFNRLAVKIQDTYKKLDSMQNAYDKIDIATFSYFDVSILTHQEKKTYNYLLKIINFLVFKSDKIGQLSAPKSAVIQWWGQLEKNRIEEINEVLNDLEKDIKIECVRPVYTVEHDLVREAFIGIKGLNLEQLDDVLLKVLQGLRSEQLDDVFLKPLIRHLRDLADIEVDQYSLLFVDDDMHPQRPYAILLTRNCLHHVKEFVGTTEAFEWNNYDRPRLVPLQEDALKSLPEISPTKTDEGFLSISKIMDNLWRITEVRQRLSPNVKVESIWLKKLEDKYYLELKNSLANLRANASQEKTWRGYHNLIEAVVNGGESLTVDSLEKYVVSN